MTAKDINGNEIKVGDTVERVVYSESPPCKVKLGESYLVESISNVSYVPYLRLEGIVGSYYANKFKVIKKQPFTKADLKDGMVVTYRESYCSDNLRRVVFKGSLYRFSEGGMSMSHGVYLRYYSDTLEYDNDGDMDIMKVTYMDEVLWEREELSTEQKRIKELEDGIAKASLIIKGQQGDTQELQEFLNKLL